MIERISIEVRGQGLHCITDDITTVVAASGLKEGLCTLFIRHTSASLLIQENYDDSARVDLEHWLNRLVPENDPLYTQTLPAVCSNNLEALMSLRKAEGEAFWVYRDKLHPPMAHETLAHCPPFRMSQNRPYRPGHGCRPL
jgi:hypothetical protein